MYYILHILLVYLCILPSLCTDVYTKIMMGYPNELIKTILFSTVGIIYGIVHYCINYLYMKEGKLNSKVTLYYPITVMIIFIIALFRNYLSTDWNNVKLNHPGFYILIISVIMWALIGYLICNLLYKKQSLKANIEFKKVYFKKLLLKFIVLIVVVFVVQWSTELIKNEIFTFKYGEPFKNADYHINMLGDEEYFKVIDYSDVQAEIYYVTKGMTCGSKVKFRYKEDKWTFIGYSTVWSTTGSASETIWPYWWHFIYGGF